MKLVRAMDEGRCAGGNSAAGELQAASKAACNLQRERTRQITLARRRWGLVQQRVLTHGQQPATSNQVCKVVNAATTVGEE